MKTIFAKLALIILFSYCMLGATTSPNNDAPAMPSTVRGIYITQTTLEDTQFIKYLIANAKNTGINTFVIDLDKPSKRYSQNIQLVKESGIAYVARIVMFPGGGTTEQVSNPSYWQRKYNLVQAAIGYGASQIQLDYIRYNTKRGASPEHAKDIHKIITWYKEKLAAQHIPLQVDIFGIASYGPENHIGQDVELFSSSVDVLCPMVYPSHYSPFKKHFETPYETVYESLASIKDQFDGKIPVKLIPYIELSNYHYPLSQGKKVAYIEAQLKAVKDAGADGWYAWSPNNVYETLFKVLEMQKK